MSQPPNGPAAPEPSPTPVPPSWAIGKLTDARGRTIGLALQVTILFDEASAGNFSTEIAKIVREITSGLILP